MQPRKLIRSISIRGGICPKTGTFTQFKSESINCAILLRKPQKHVKYLLDILKSSLLLYFLFCPFGAKRPISSFLGWLWLQRVGGRYRHSLKLLQKLSATPPLSNPLLNPFCTKTFSLPVSSSALFVKDIYPPIIDIWYDMIRYDMLRISFASRMSHESLESRGPREWHMSRMSCGVCLLKIEHGYPMYTTHTYVTFVTFVPYHEPYLNFHFSYGHSKSYSQWPYWGWFVIMWQVAGRSLGIFTTVVPPHFPD